MAAPVAAPVQRSGHNLPVVGHGGGLEAVDFRVREGPKFRARPESMDPFIDGIFHGFSHKKHRPSWVPP